MVVCVRVGVSGKTAWASEAAAVSECGQSAADRSVLSSDLLCGQTADRRLNVRLCARERCPCRNQTAELILEAVFPKYGKPAAASSTEGQDGHPSSPPGLPFLHGAQAGPGVPQAACQSSPNHTHPGTEVQRRHLDGGSAERCGSSRLRLLKRVHGGESDGAFPAAFRGADMFQRARKRPGLLKQEEESRPCLSPLYPENVFIDGNRPQFLQDLHTEAQEGLKIQQQEENGMDYQDDESVVSTVTLQTGDDGSLADSMRTLGSGDTATDAMSTVSGVSAVSMVSGVSAVSDASTVSTRSSRSGLTRQGSTFKPISGSKRPERTRRRSKRATVAGIPQHVKRELGLDRGPWQTQVSPTEGPLPNGEGVVMLVEEEEVDAGGTPESVREHLELLEVLEAAEEQQLQRQRLQAQYRGDLAVARSAGPRLSPRRRPRSVLVPGVIPKAPAPLPAAAGSPSEAFPPSPVMYVSPQATYLSKIIPNAVLPGDVDVIEISRKGRSRGSVRTLSRSSLTAPSPALSRASSDSDSSHTVVSDSSTISSGGGRGRGRKATQEAGRGGGMPSPTSPTSLMSPDQLSLHSSISCSSNITSVSQQGWDDQGPFGRSLSVKKAKKNPPAPPRRTNSLHPSKLRRRSRDAQLDGPAQSSSPAYSADQSQISSSSSSSSSSAVAGLPAPVQSNGIDMTLSPSSGYGSQNPTPAVSPYSIYPQAVQQRAPLTRPKTSAPLVITSAILAFGAPPEVPPHPRVKAPTPPPPETWIHDQRSFDLLIGPSAVQRNLFVALQKVRLDRQRRPPVAGGAQKKEPPPVMKKSGFIKTEVLRHAGPPPPSSASGPQHPSESDSAWPLPPPPPVELLPGSVFDGQDETDLLPPPPLQDGAGSPPVPPGVCPAPPVATTLLIMATPTPVTMETVPPAVHAHQQTQDVPAPAAIEVQTSVLAVPTVAPPPPPVEEQTPPTCPADSGPANQEAPSVAPQPKSSPTPKRDPCVPMTTSALLQLVRMRASEPRNTGEQPGQNQNQADGQGAVPRPETLPLTALPPAVKYPPPSTGPAPSMRLQEAIRMKTAAMPTSRRAELARVSAPAKTAKVPPPVAKKPGQSAAAGREPPVAPATEAQQRRDGVTPAVADNGGGNTPRATETEPEQTRENGEPPDASPVLLLCQSGCHTHKHFLPTWQATPSAILHIVCSLCSWLPLAAAVAVAVSQRSLTGEKWAEEV
ncbi:hypothetical protein COCON_G00001250 [Conger conger]|uniref:Uncharacterized protein n=1 Tax=Conger conger TaxID=82655 RepID=A0A9Q1E0R6_CONCO|nr:hypothetical protein COCON_G00001250 [Conger conger]